MTWFNAGLGSSGGGGGGSSSHNYSTNEQVIGTWIDGSTVYEKTVQFTTPSSNTYTSVDFGITGVNRVWIFSDATFVMNTTQTATVGTYNSSPQADQFVGLANNNNGSIAFHYRVGANFQGGKIGYATLHYTKTT